VTASSAQPMRPSRRRWRIMTASTYTAA
jgi:hypothetical protein